MTTDNLNEVKNNLEKLEAIQLEVLFMEASQKITEKISIVYEELMKKILAIDDPDQQSSLQNHLIQEAENLLQLSYQSADSLFQNFQIDTGFYLGPDEN